MARAGLCSRRDAESWIAAGRVAVNGRVIDSPALNVGAQDRITVDGAALPEQEPTRLFLFHKPRGLVTTARDPEGRPTIFEHLPEGLPRVISVGRLDINTEGLMLLTNDGGLARVLELPATGWLRRYRVRANGTVDQAQLDALKEGVTIEGVEYAGIEAVLDRQQGANVWLTMGLREGKNREIKRVLESLGLAVTRLIRVSFGPFQLGELVAGAAESVPTRILREQLGPDLAAKAGVSFPDASSRPPSATRHEARHEARPRAHVSALRSARDEAAEGPRRRIERAATADRKGRAVKVERVVPVGTAPSRDGAAPGRNARRFSAEKRDGAPARRPTRDRAEASERPQRDGAVRFREQTRDDRRSDVSEKPGAERPRIERSRAVRPRAFGDEQRGERSGSEGDFSTATRSAQRRDDRGSGSDEKPRTAKPRGFGNSARDDRPPGGAGKPRQASGKPNGRTGGFGSERPATGRNRPDASKDRGFGSERPVTGRNRPDASKDRGFGSERPATGRNRPDASKDRGFGSERPATGRNRPDASKDRGFGSERPATGRNRPDASKDRGAERPARGASRPPASRGAGFKSGDRPAAGGRPFGGKPSGGRPAGGRPPRGRP